MYHYIDTLYSVIYYLMTVFSSIEAYFLLGEEIYKAQIYGGLLVILGIYLTNKHTKEVDFERP